MEFIGGVIATYLVSRAMLRLVRNLAGEVPRAVAAHLASLAALTLLVKWLEGTGTSVLTYIPGQLIWLAFDLTRHKIALKLTGTGARAGRGHRRRGGTKSKDIVGRMTALVIGLMAIGYVWYGNSLFADQSRTYAAIPVAATPPDVLYYVGKPELVRRHGERWSRVGEPRSYSEWLYISPFVHVRFSSERARVDSISCREDSVPVRARCPATLGVTIGATEWEVMDALGPPSNTQLFDGGTKLMNYPEAGQSFVLEKFRVKMIRLYPESGDTSARLLRLIAFLIP